VTSRVRGSVTEGFAAASHVGWWIMFGSGLAVVVLALVTTGSGRGPRRAGRPPSWRRPIRWRCRHDAGRAGLAGDAALTESYDRRRAVADTLGMSFVRTRRCAGWPRPR